jgi:predicted GIY-YIG superfamily endonuclease
VLQVSSRTVREDIRELQRDGNLVRTRGNEHDIGRGVSHKSRIIDLYLKGYTYDEIIRKTRHSAHSIKRYVSSFGRLLLIISHGIEDISEISRLLHQSERLTKEYLELYDKHKREGHWPKVYIELLEQLKALYPSKKKTPGRVVSVVKIVKVYADLSRKSISRLTCRGGGSIMQKQTNNRYESIPKRSFFNAIVKLLEEQYKIIGSRKVITMIAADIVELHKEFYPAIEKRGFGQIVWQTTAATDKKAGYGKRAEDYGVKVVILPLVTKEDIENRIKSFYGRDNYQKQHQRDIEVMSRLIKSAYEQGGLLSGAELSVLLNRSLATIGRYMRIYHQSHKDILPTKGIILDQGSRPTHKATIIDSYEQGYPEIDIARFTNHSIEAVGRYIKSYKNIKLLMEKGFNLMEMVRVSGMGRSTIIQYKELIEVYHPEQRDEKRNEGNSGRPTAS